MDYADFQYATLYIIAFGVSVILISTLFHLVSYVWPHLQHKTVSYPWIGLRGAKYGKQRLAPAQHWPAGSELAGVSFVFHGTALTKPTGVSRLFVLISFTASWAAAVVVGYLCLVYLCTTLSLSLTCAQVVLMTFKKQSVSSHVASLCHLVCTHRNITRIWFIPRSSVGNAT